MALTFVDGRVVSAQEVTRLAAAIAGTYVVPTASGGAVSTSAAMTVAVAAITTTTGLYVNAVQDTTGYAGGTTVIATADPTNPRRDYVWYDGAGAIGNTTGTPAANPVLPDLTAGRIALAEIYVTAGLATIASGNIIDRRANVAVVSVATAAIYGSSTTEVTATSGSAADYVVISGLSIAAGKPFRVKFMYRKSAGSASAAAFGITLNATAVLTAAVTAGKPRTSANNGAEQGIAVYEFFPGETNYTGGVNYSYVTYASGGLTVATSSWTDATTPTVQLPLDAVMPTATVTSVTIRGIGNASMTTGVKNVYVEAI